MKICPKNGAICGISACPDDKCIEDILKDQSYTIEDIEKAFDAGYRRCDIEWMGLNRLQYPDKEQYIKSITK